MRKAKKEDMEIIEDMMGMLFPDADIQHKEDDVYLLAEKKGFPVGFCHLRFRESSCYIVGLGVLPEFRAHGIGSMLMERALAMIDRKGVRTTTLKVSAINTAASLYVKFGFYERKYGQTLILVRKQSN